MTGNLLSLSELRTKWHQERSFYQDSEIGTGVQVFVKDILKSPEVLGLRVGLNSTKLAHRKYEFLEEKTSRGSRKPDITIFINPEIIIPVEVEKFKNIDAGKTQLWRYQIDLEKKYGILTDGYTWRFYNNNVYTEYTLPTIFDRKDLFLEFWGEYIKPEKYYLSFFEGQGQRSLLKETEQLPVEDNRQIFFEDITQLIESFKNKLDIEGYLNEVTKSEKSKKAIEITYAYIIQFILYKTLIDNEFADFPGEYEAQIKAIHEHLRNNNFKYILGIIDGISAQISKNIYRPFAKEQEFIRTTLTELYQKPRNELHDVSPWLDIYVFIKKYKFAEVRNEIFGYIYENYLKALYEDKKKGQYFTDPGVVNFMLEQIDYNPQNIKRRMAADVNRISLIDCACGSGTFLYSAVDALIRAINPTSEQLSKKVEELVNNNIFGLDIAEFPLYLAEMNILMRMLPLIISEKYNNPVDKKIKVFKTKDSIAEFMDTSLRNTINDIDVAYEKNKGQNFFAFKDELDLGYSSYVRDEDDLKEMKDSLESQPQCPRRRFDFVIGNPPYVGYNESSKQGVLVFSLLKKKEVRLNDIYGVNLHSIPGKPKRYRPNPNLYAFFIALGLALLKDNGKLCYIIPQTILTAGDLDVLRFHLAKFTTMEKIITFSGKMFIGRGLRQNKPVPTSSLIFVLNRTLPTDSHKVEIINYSYAQDEIGECLKNILLGKKIRKKNILQKKLLQSSSNWNFINHSKTIGEFFEEYRAKTRDISIYYDHGLANYEFKSAFYFDSGYSIDERQILPKPPREDHYEYPKIRNDLWTIKEGRGFWPDIRKGGSPNVIKLRQANQGYNLLDCPYKIIWSYANPQRFHFTSIPVIWARNQICAIGSKNLKEILYLFAILNSPIINMILRCNLESKQEKDYLVSTSAIKEFVCLPKITKDNQYIKKEIIEKTEKMLVLEEVKLGDLVDFSRVMMQKYDAISAEGNYLVLYKDERERKVKIKSKKALVEKTILEKYTSDELEFDREKITLSELRNLPAIDFKKQAVLKEYIDDLVFALYFDVPLRRIGLRYADEIKKQCQKNKYYQLLKKPC